MIVLAGLAAGFVVGSAVWAALRAEFVDAEVLATKNYRGVHVPAAAGICIVITTVIIAAGYAVAVRFGGLSTDEQTRGATLLGPGALGFGLLGLLDDVLGTASAKGFRGHIGALRGGRVTTGLVKLVGGVLVGALVVADLGEKDLVGVMRGGLLVAASANLANLFDRAPGRVIKVSTLGFAIVVALDAPSWHLLGPTVIAGAGLSMLWPDLRERCMLGDTGSNVLGAGVGFGLAIALGSTAEWIALAVVVGLNVSSEFVSFTRVIDSIRFLRWADRAGSLPDRKRFGAGER